MSRAVLIPTVVTATLLLRAASAPGGDGPGAGEAAVGAVLDDFHAAAAAADGPRYFGHFAPEGVFLGTDATERWTLDEFKTFAKPYFEKGKGWTYKARSRHVQMAPGGDLAWFDEALDSPSYGECRGSGVLRRIEKDWKVAQYDLTIPIPNDLAREVVTRIRAGTVPAETETIVYVVRHAERESGPRDADPPLTEKGLKRAQALARTLRSVPLKTIYTSDTRRTRATLAPTAVQCGLEPAIYDPKEPEKLASLLRGASPGQEILVCGHANSIPGLLERLGVKGAVEVQEEEHDALFVVTLSPGHATRVTHLHYGD